MNPRALLPFLLLAVITYKQDIQPILDNRCVECHSMGSDLDLSSFPFKYKDNVDQVLLVDKILEKTGATPAKMPPSPRPKLTTAQVGLIQEWKDQGLNP